MSAWSMTGAWTMVWGLPEGVQQLGRGRQMRKNWDGGNSINNKINLKKKINW